MILEYLDIKIKSACSLTFVQNSYERHPFCWQRYLFSAVLWFTSALTYRKMTKHHAYFGTTAQCCWHFFITFRNPRLLLYLLAPLTKECEMFNQTPSIVHNYGRTCRIYAALNCIDSCWYNDSKVYAYLVLKENKKQEYVIL